MNNVTSPSMNSKQIILINYLSYTVRHYPYALLLHKYANILGRVVYQLTSVLINYLKPQIKTTKTHWAGEKDTQSN